MTTKFLWLDGPSIDEILNTLNPTTGKRNTNIRKVVALSQHLSITGCYLDTEMLLKA